VSTRGRFKLRHGRHDLGSRFDDAVDQYAAWVWSGLLRHPGWVLFAFLLLFLPMDGLRPQPALPQSASSGGALLLPHVDDDILSSWVELTEIPAQDIRRDPSGRLIPEGPRVRVVDGSAGIMIDRLDAAPFPAEGSVDGGLGVPDVELTARHSIAERPEVVFSPKELEAWLAFETGDTAIRTYETWAGRPLFRGPVTVVLGAYPDPRGGYSRETRSVLLGVIPVRDSRNGVTFDLGMGTFRDVMGHELGHALEDALKPNLWNASVRMKALSWSVSFLENLGDGLAMWSSLDRSRRIEDLWAETGGDLRRPNALSGIARAVAEQVSKSEAGASGPIATNMLAPLRESANSLRLGDLSPITGYLRVKALDGNEYESFVQVHEAQVRAGVPPLVALGLAANVMGLLDVQKLYYLPENDLSHVEPYADLAHAYILADEYLFGGEHRDILLSEALKRGLVHLRPNGTPNWPDRTVPDLTLDPAEIEPAALERWLNEHNAELGIPKGFSVRLQEAFTTEYRQLVIRTQLMLGNGPSAVPLYNHGNLIFVWKRRVDATPSSWSLQWFNPAFPYEIMDPQQALDKLAEAPRDVELRLGDVYVLWAYQDGTCDVRAAHPRGLAQWIDGKQPLFEDESGPRALDILNAGTAAPPETERR
jgi:hypothetical protein